jgi:basic membrane protein A and related proteins
MRKLRLFAALGAALVVSVGCGGGGGGGEDTGGGGGGGEAEQEAALVLDVGGLGDQSFNDSAFRGLEQANEEFGTGTEYLESGSPTDYVGNLTQLAESGYNPTFAIGFLMTDAVAEVAPQFPDTNFAIVDSVVPDMENVASLTFRDEEGGYMVGVVAGAMTQEDTEFTTSDEQVVGFIGGQESDLIATFQAGFEAGVESACPDCEVVVQYAGTTPEAFNDPARGSEIARQQVGEGADVIYHAAGATGAGLFEVAGQEDIFAIGTDSDQAAAFPDAPILTSAIKGVDAAVYQTIADQQNDEFPGGEVIDLGLAEGGYDLAPFGDFDDQVPQEVKDQIEEARQGIIDGDIEVPDTIE